MWFDPQAAHGRCDDDVSPAQSLGVDLYVEAAVADAMAASTFTVLDPFCGSDEVPRLVTSDFALHAHQIPQHHARDLTAAMQYQKVVRLRHEPRE